MIAYKKEGINLLTRYTLEFINSEKDLDYVNSGKFNHGEPWERYKKKVYDNIDDAMSIYMIYLVRDDILDVKLFEEILLNDETIQERYIEPNSTTAYSIKTWVNKSLHDMKSKAEKQVEILETENNLYKQFIKQFNAENTFNEYMKQNIETKTYRYYSLERPISIGTYPKKVNVINIVNYDNKQLSDEIGRLVWGYIEYSEPLTTQDCNEYELEPNKDTWKEIKTA